MVDRTVIDVTDPAAEPLPPLTEWEAEPDGDDWLEAMSDDGPRTAVYLDSHGREMRLTHPGLIAPAAITMLEGVPAGPVEFIWKGDDPQ